MRTLRTCLALLVTLGLVFGSASALTIATAMAGPTNTIQAMPAEHDCTAMQSEGKAVKTPICVQNVGCVLPLATLPAITASATGPVIWYGVAYADGTRRFTGRVPALEDPPPIA